MNKTAPVTEPLSEQTSRLPRRSESAWMIWLTFAIAISNFTIAYLFHSQLNLMDDQLKEMRKSSDQIDATIGAFRSMADSAAKSANLASEAIAANKTQQRARIMVRVDNLSVYFKNVGQTQANNVTRWGDWGIYEFPLAPTEKISELDLSNDPAETRDSLVLQNGQEEHITPPSGQYVTSKELAKLQDGKRRLFLVGKFSYDDIYKERHYTRFCMYYTLEAVNAAIGGAQLCGTHCDRFNDAD
jgi:hypothetical protein